MNNPILVPCIKCEREDHKMYPYLDIKKSYPVDIAQNIQTIEGFEVKKLQGFLCEKHWKQEFGGKSKRE